MENCHSPIPGILKEWNLLGNWHPYSPCDLLGPQCWRRLHGRWRSGIMRLDFFWIKDTKYSTLQINFPINPHFQSHYIFISNFLAFKRSNKAAFKHCSFSKVLITYFKKGSHNTLYSVSAPISLCIAKCKSRIRQYFM